MDKLDSLKENILIWYPFKENSTILYLTRDCNDIIGKEYLSKLCKKLDIYNFENIEEVKIEEKYDYVILLGTLEYANEIMKEDENPYLKLLEFAKSEIKDNGKVLLSIDNRLGVKYIVGNKNKHCEKIYDSIKNKYTEGKMFSKKEITDLISKCGFEYKRFYYPLPDYKYANVIYTDSKLPDKNDSKINYNVIYDDGSLILQDENILLKQFIREGNFTEYTNSYFIELSNVPIETNINYISYNNMRKDEYSLILKIYNDKVEKHAKNEKAKEHIKKINENTRKLRELGFELAEEENNEESIVEKFINYPLLDSYITALVKQGENEKVFEIIDNWYKFVKEKLQADENGIVKDGFIDLVFENTFYNEKENKFIFFDQEWYMENINIKFILYRAIENLYEHNKNMNNFIPKEEIKARYKIEDNEEFKRLEKELQEKVIDKDRQQEYGKQYDYMISAEEVKKVIRETKEVYESNINLIKQIEELENENKELKDDVFYKLKSKLKGKNKK